MRTGSILAALILASCSKPPEPPASPPPPTPGPSRGDFEAGAGPEGRVAGDGRIAFIREGRSLWTVNPDGSDAREVVPAAGSAWMCRPAWSPNRRWIAFAWERDPEHNLYRRNLFVVRSDGGGLRQVTPLPGAGILFENAPTTTVSGTAVALLPGGRLGLENAEVAVYGRRELFKTGPAGRFQVEVPSTTAWIKVSVVRDGVRYTGCSLRPFRSGQPADVGEIHLTPDGADDSADRPGWSPDGRFLYHLLTMPGLPPAPPRTVLRRIRLDGAEAEAIQLASEAGWIGGPLIAANRVWVLRRYGRASAFDPATRREMERIDLGTTASDSIARSPDGAFAVVSTDPGSGACRIALWSGGRTEPILERPAGTSVRGLDFSPDGKSLVAGLAEAGRVDLAVLGDGPPKPITKDGASGDPAWGGR